MSFTKAIVSLSTAENKEQAFQSKTFSFPFLKSPSVSTSPCFSYENKSARKKKICAFNQAEINVLCNIAVEVHE